MTERARDAHHVVSPLMRESLMDKRLIAATESPVRAILPKLNVIQIGGRSIMDRGHAAVLPLLDEIIELGLLLEDIGAGRAGGLLLQGQMHAFMAAILLRVPRFNAFDGDA